MRKNRFFYCLLLVCALVLVSATGCGTFKRKFIRARPPEPPHAQLHYEEKEYERPAVRVQYEEALSLWRIWHSEAASSFGLLNRKRTRNSLKEALAQLSVMEGLLQGKKAEELSAHIQKLQAAEKALERETGYPSETDGFRILIEQKFREIDAGFSVDRVEPFLVSDSSIK